MEKVVYILIISWMVDYWIKRIFRIVYDCIHEIKRREYLEEKGIKLDAFGDVIESPKVVTDFKSDFEQFVFKKME